MFALRLTVLALTILLTFVVVWKATKALGIHKRAFGRAIDNFPVDEKSLATNRLGAMITEFFIWSLWIIALVLSFWMFLGATTISP